MNNPSPYILESEDEFNRLEKQSRDPHYDFRDELRSISIKPGAKVLDAGCGSGVVCRYLAKRESNAQIFGVDISQSRIELAKECAQDLSNITFMVEDLTSTKFSNNHFDVIICRYVLQHLKFDDRYKLVLKELQRILKPGGQLICVDTDGLCTNLYPLSTELFESLQTVSQLGPVDLHIGRKLPYYLSNIGFANVSISIDVMQFSGEALITESKLMKERFEAALPHFEAILGKSRAQKFVTEYIDTMNNPSANYFVNKFIVSAVKPRSQHLVDSKKS